jgi:hypothetical protein
MKAGTGLKVFGARPDSEVVSINTWPEFVACDVCSSNYAKKAERL